MLERINSRLRAEGIPAVEMIILKWRVSQLLRDIQRKYGTCHGCCQLPYIPTVMHSQLTFDRLAEGSMVAGMQGSNLGSPTQLQTQSPDGSMRHSSSPQRSDYSPNESRPYDPIRDV
jgi:hypothetical protein